MIPLSASGHLLAAIFSIVAGLHPPAAQPPVEPVVAKVPWGVGERLDYEVDCSVICGGSASMEVMGQDTIRGSLAWHSEFRIKGRALFVLSVNDVFSSWMDVENLHSLRYTTDQDEPGGDRNKFYDIFPDRSVYQERGQPELPSVADPLDEGSFLYFLRTVPLEVGRVDTFPRYFRPDRNPVIIKVVRREPAVKVPAGTFAAIVIQPIIKTKGLFSENGRAEVWIRDDSTRIMIQMKSKFGPTSVNLKLKSYRPAPATPIPAAKPPAQ